MSLMFIRMFFLVLSVVVGFLIGASSASLNIFEVFG